MDMIVLDPVEQSDLKRKREVSEADRFDEVWQGVYVVSPLPDVEHQDLVANLTIVFGIVISHPGLGKVYPGVNVSDREDDWEHNYRGPDVVVLLNGSRAVNNGTHLVGGPDFVVEVISQYDRSRTKFDFYAQIGVRELLMVDRIPWAIELYRLIDNKLVMVGKSTLDDPLILLSEVLPLSFQLVPGDDRSAVRIVHADGVQTWSA